MKIRNKIIIVLLICSTVIGCSNKITIKEAWEYGESIQYSDDKSERDVQIAEAMACFDKVKTKNKSPWYLNNQKCNYFRNLCWLKHVISDEEFLKFTKTIYDEYFISNPKTKEKLFAYASILYAQGLIEEAHKYIVESYDENYSYNMENPSDIDFANFFSGLILKKIDIKDFKDTKYVSSLFDFPNAKDNFLKDVSRLYAKGLTGEVEKIIVQIRDSNHSYEIENPIESDIETMISEIIVIGVGVNIRDKTGYIEIKEGGPQDFIGNPLAFVGM